MGKADHYRKGVWNAICDTCGLKFKSDQLYKTWDGYMVCTKCWEPRQPQDFVRGRRDIQRVPWDRPDKVVKTNRERSLSAALSVGDDIIYLDDVSGIEQYTPLYIGCDGVEEDLFFSVLTLNEVTAGTQDFTTYTIANPDSDYTIVPATVTVTTATTPSESYVLMDTRGITDADFEHRFEFTCTAIDNGGYFDVWTAVEELTTIDTATLPYVYVSFTDAGVGAYEIYIASVWGGDDTGDLGITLPCTYYCTITRVSLAWTVYIYSDSARTVLVDTLTMAAGGGVLDPDIKYVGLSHPGLAVSGFSGTVKHYWFGGGIKINRKMPYTAASGNTVYVNKDEDVFLRVGDVSVDDLG